MLLLDEPTNHLDLAGIEWLEEVLEAAAVRVRRGQPRSLFSGKCGERNGGTEPGISGRHSAGTRELHRHFWRRRKNFCTRRRKRQEALENLVHTEIEWLRRGAKARTRKSKARIDKADELMGELADLNARTRTVTRANRFLGDGPEDEAADRIAEGRL